MRDAEQRADVTAAARSLAAAGFGIGKAAGIVEDGGCTCRLRGACPSPGKHPIGREWHLHTSMKPVVIGMLFRSGLVAPNSAIFPRPGSGLMIVDLDDMAALTALGRLPETFTVRTAKGLHLYFQLPAGTDEADVPRGFEGGDVRVGGSGMVIGPWSRHASGVRYTPVHANAEVVVAPGSLIEALRARPPRTRDGALGRGEGRHPFLVGQARKHRGWGEDRDVVLDSLRELNDEYCDPPLGEGELDRIVAWATANVEPDASMTRVRRSTSRERAQAGERGQSAEPIAVPTGRRFEIISARDLLVTEFAPIEFVVPDLLPEGTALLVSPPKVGKSSLVVQIVVALRFGGEVLGRTVEVRDALYLALEDGRRRMQDRLLTHVAPYRAIYKPMRDLGIVLEAPRIGDGLEEMLAAWYDEHPRGAVFVDTLQHVRPVSAGRRNAYEVDVEDFRKLRAVIADRPGACLTLVHHTNKPNSADDFLVAVSGTHGLAGTADTTIRVKRDRHSPDGVLEVTGRDIEELELPVRYEDLIWSADTERPLPNASSRRNEIALWIRERNEPAWPAEVATGLGLSRNNAQGVMSSMVEAGELVKSRAGYDVIRVHVPASQGHSLTVRRGRHSSPSSSAGDSGNSDYSDNSGDSEEVSDRDNLDEAPER